MGRKQAFTCSRSQYRQEFPHYCVFVPPAYCFPAKTLPLPRLNPVYRRLSPTFLGAHQRNGSKGVLWCVNADVAKSVWRARGSHRTDCVASLTRTDPKGLCSALGFGTCGRFGTGQDRYWHVFGATPLVSTCLCLSVTIPL